MKTSIFLFLVLIFFSSLIISTESCKDDDNNIHKDTIDSLAGKKPIVEIVAATLETNWSVFCTGLIGSDNGYTVTDRGFCYSSTNISPTIADNKVSVGQGIGSFIDTIYGLTASTRYYVKAFATNKAGTAYGSTMSFVTKPATLGEIEIVSYKHLNDSASFTIRLLSTGGETITEKGLIYSKSPISGMNGIKIQSTSQNNLFVITVYNMENQKDYYFKAYAINEIGNAFSNEITFHVINTSSIQDIDGNYYRTIQIHDQTWTVDNLKVTKFNDGTLLHCINDFNQWNGKTTPAYCWYDNIQIPNYPEQGVLYNAYTLQINKEICPSGWHVPTREDYDHLINNLERDFPDISNDEYKLGSVLSALGENYYGFSIYPFGIRSYSSPETDGFYGYYDTASNNNINNWGVSYLWLNNHELSFPYSNELIDYKVGFSDDEFGEISTQYIVTFFYDANIGGSIRCIKDE